MMARPDDVGVGVAIVLEHRGKILLLRREGSHAAGAWAVPGGWIDRNDAHPLDVVKREALEEVGITVHDAVLVGVTSEDHAKFRSVTLYYLATRWEGDPQLREPQKCSALQWHPLYEALPVPMFPGLAEGVSFAINHREQGV